MAKAALTVSPSTLSLQVGDTATLVASLANGVIVGALWSSSNKARVYVNKDTGLVTALVASSETITATYRGTKATCAVTVLAAPVTDLTITCPGDQTVTGTGALTVVKLGPIQTSGGVAPIVVTFQPPVGTAFPIGTTLVTATAVSADLQRATCQYSVTVTGSFPPPPGPLTVTCPATVVAYTPDGDPVAVTFAATTTGGTAPVTITYSPASGSAFALGTTGVLVTATSTDGQTAICSFSVTVQNAADSTQRGPQASITCLVGSVRIVPGQSIQAAVNAAPAGTAFCLATGTHNITTAITPKAGNSFIGEYGAILAGGDVASAAFAPAVNNVTVRNLIVEHFANPVQFGAISAEGRSGWVIANNEARLNFGYGIRIGPGAQVLRNNVHHNGQLGIGGSGANDVLVEDNEIAYNNQNGNDPGWEAGGTKFTVTDRLTVRKNWSHHNIGPGLWTDINNIHTLYENNVVEDNTQMGIFHEISYDAIIRNNIVRRNGAGFSTYIFGAGILIAASQNVEVYGNTLEGNADGIGAIQQNRPEMPSAYGPHIVVNLYVHDNDVTMTEGWTGAVQDVGDNAIFSSRNNRFLANTYHVSGVAQLFTWDNQELTLAQWQAKGLQ